MIDVTPNTKKQLIDQTAHFAVAIAILCLTLYGFIGCVLAGLCIGLVREQGQHGWNILNWSKMVWLDVSAWTVGGAIAGIIIGSTLQMGWVVCSNCDTEFHVISDNDNPIVCCPFCGADIEPATDVEDEYDDYS